MNHSWDNFQFIDYLNVKENEVDNLPDGVTISTITASCKPGLLTDINLDNIWKYMPLNSDDILTVKVNNDNIRTLIPKKIKKRRNNKKTVVKKKSKGKFFHQITIVVRIKQGEVEDLSKSEKINIKVFRNGSLQMSGINKISYANRAINKLIYRLKQSKAKMINKKIEQIKFVNNPEDIGIGKFKIDMINTNYKVNMTIDRDCLYNLLLKMKMRVSYEKCIRACVIVKYTPKINNPMLIDCMDRILIYLVVSYQLFIF